MATSSIHIDNGKISYFKHNDRTTSTVNTIFNNEENFYSCKSEIAIQLFQDELEKRIKAYLKNNPSRKKIHSKTITHLSAIVNLNKNHTENDVLKVVRHIEKTFDTKVIQYCIHRDEGHIRDGKDIKNYHCHIEFMGLNSSGNSIKRNIKKKDLIDLQTAVANILNMERGTNYNKERKSRPIRLNTYEYKAHKQELERITKNLEFKIIIENVILKLKRAKEETTLFKRIDYELSNLEYKILSYKMDGVQKVIINSLLEATIDFLENKQKEIIGEKHLDSEVLERENRKLKQQINQKDLIILDLKNEVEELEIINNDIEIKRSIILKQKKKLEELEHLVENQKMKIESMNLTTTTKELLNDKSDFNL